MIPVVNVAGFRWKLDHPWMFNRSDRSARPRYVSSVKTESACSVCHGPSLVDPSNPIEILMNIVTRIPLALVAFVLVTEIASAQKIIGPEIAKVPVAADAFHTSTIAKVSPSVRAWIAAQASSLTISKTAPSAAETSLRTSIASRFSGQTLQSENVDAMTMLVFTEKVKSLRDQITQQRDKVNLLGQLLQSLQGLRDELRLAREENARMKATDLCATLGCNRVNARIDTIITLRNRAKIARGILIGRVNTVGDLQKANDAIKGNMDSMSEMGETESLTLQMMMDAYAQAMQTISNLLKKHSDTAAAIIANLK